MKHQRRDFIRKSAGLAAAALVGGSGAALANIASGKDIAALTGKDNLPMAASYIKDAGMEMSEAYFAGMQQEKIALTRQMEVFGAVAGIDTKMVNMPDAKPWEPAAIIAVKEAWEKAGLKLNVIEGPPALGEKTKLGLPGRDEEIANFINFMKNIKKYGGVDTICYNWMPVIGWYRTNYAKAGRGGALVTAFDYEDIKNAPLTPYGEVSKETLWQTLEYFLKAVVPEAEAAGVKLAMHPDDPQVDSIKGISRIMTTVDNFREMVDLVPSPANGITMCQGNFSLMGADIPTVVHEFGKRKLIHFVHFRNVRGGKFKFEETFHDEGQIDMYAAMKAYYDIGFRGPIRPDHVPTMYGDSNEHPGYSVIGTLFALGYMRGLMESIAKSNA
jgi:mannonate dehydratase